MKRLLPPLLVLITALCGCVHPPAGVPTVENFSVDRYLGRWYEIVRLDHSFERGLTNVSAEYSRRDDGGLRVVNRGYDPQKKRWKEAIGRAYFVEGKERGLLKVSFFGPFYGAYNIIELDQEDYSWALVCGPDDNYLWILSRTPDLDRAVTERLLDKAALLGFDVSGIIRVSQQQVPRP